MPTAPGMDREPPASIWTRHILILATTVFFAGFGSGLQSGVSTNFMVHNLGLGGDQILWLAGIREIPGLALILMAALIMRLPQSSRASFSLLLMGLGYGSFYLVHSYATLIALSLIASIGFHNWMPLLSSLGMGLVDRKHSGRILGRMHSVSSLASMGGMLIVVLGAERLGLRPFFALGGLFLIVAAMVVSRMPKTIGANTAGVPRIVLRRRYWLFYVLTFFEGSRTQVFHTFGAWVLVHNYGYGASRISMLLILSALLRSAIAPRLGNWIDRFGERRSLSLSYIALALVFVAYATLHHAWVLGGLYIAINLLVMFRIGLHTYINRIAPAEDLSPTLAAGVSINHISSVGISLVAGSLLHTIGYEGLCWGAAGLILASVPFALALRVQRPEECSVA